MDESLQEFESELKALAPRRLDPQFVNRVANELTMTSVGFASPETNGVTTSSSIILWRWMTVGAFGIAAAFALFFVVAHAPRKNAVTGFSPHENTVRNPGPSENKQPGNPGSTDTYQPVAASNILYEMKDEGPSDLQSGHIERRVRYRYMDTYTWKNPHNHASLTWSVPRDEIRVQPAQFN